MNASVERLDTQPPAVSDADNQVSSVERAPATNDKICWIAVSESPFQPDQQVELLHLQAEADALLLQLQAAQQKRQASISALAGN
jgi:hypothetical protein